MVHGGISLKHIYVRAKKVDSAQSAGRSARVSAMRASQWSCECNHAPGAFHHALTLKEGLSWVRAPQLGNPMETAKTQSQQLVITDFAFIVS